MLMFHSDAGAWLRTTMRPSRVMFLEMTPSLSTLATAFWSSQTNTQKKGNSVPAKGGALVNPHVFLYVCSISGRVYKKLAAVDASGWGEMTKASYEGVSSFFTLLRLEFCTYASEVTVVGVYLCTWHVAF